MQADIHPNYEVTKVVCNCGNTFETRSTLGGDLRLDICSECHPFFTGKRKIVDTEGRVEKFRRRYATYSEDDSSESDS